MTRILVVEDNRNLATGLRNNLEIEGYQVDVAADGPSGLALARSTAPDLIVLDLMLPGMDGYRVLKTLREEGIDTPVLILSARGEETDKVLGFHLGADDYVAKPFGLLELLARVDALLRRAATTQSRTKMAVPVAFGDVHVDPGTHIVRRAGEPVTLRPKEYDLLIALLQRKGQVASRTELLEEVWGYSGEVYSRTVDTHVAELRRKLEENAAEPRHILTVRKSGYRIAMP
ncbi:MAG TPA: response regulator transcription factor [Gemmatimonadaceae bacterium]|jgi:DNA-binding response OmpR family regulator|nr:response regulator transcription factor [Gemmatimonadaceae bacterium]